jgi:CDP-4-dehydro-6-deoxyglucose reductase/3-phenylpropionate/trans-cinnamate dioxygenase ferredoxin reductase subunit
VSGFGVTVAGAGIDFPCTEDQTVLDAAEAAGFAIPYSCRKGVCASCEGDLLSGEARVAGQGMVSGPAQAVRFCQTRPRSDLAIAVPVARAEPPVRRVLSARVHMVQRASSDVTILKLRFPNGVRARFRAGQYLRVTLPDGGTRNYSLANAPRTNDGAEIHVRRIAGGAFSDLIERLAVGDRLTVETAFGQCVLDPDSRRRLILAVTGTGLAPAKAMIEDLVAKGSRRPVWLYWGGRTPQDLYMAERLQALAARHDWLTFVPVLSRPANDWTGRMGYVQAAALEDHAGLADFEACACGSPAMTASAREAFLAAGLDPARFHCDAFVSSAERA